MRPLDSLKFLIYTLARIGLMFVATALAVVVGVILCPILVSLLPEGETRDFLMSEELRSVIAFIIFFVVQLVVFIDDGKRHAAYEIWSSVNITITLFFLLLVCFAPTIFRDTFEPHGKAMAVYNIVYFPFVWLEGYLDMKFVSAVLFGIVGSCVLFFLGYLLAFKRYAKLHPFIIGGEKRGEEKIRLMEQAEQSEDPLI